MLVIIQARTSSKRFKNKVMRLIYGKPLLWYVLESIKKSNKIKKLVVATSEKKSDDKVAKYLKKNNIEVFRGSLHNVANRLLKVAKLQKAKQFLRVSADSPFIDYRIINKSININKRSKFKYDLITNVFPRSFPSGMSVEIIKTNTLKRAIRFFSKFEKEHVTPYFYKNYKLFKIKNFKTSKKFKIKYSIDYPSDLRNLRKLFKNFNNNKNLINF